MSENEYKQVYAEVNGLVIRSTPVGEYDKRVVLLTKERGKITAFARGARKPGSPLMAVVSPFCFGKFRLIRGLNSYIMTEAEPSNYFEGLRGNVNAACYGMYFLEIMDYCTRENNDEAGLLLLLYQSLKALESPSIPNNLVRCVFEIRTIVIEGEYPGIPDGVQYNSSTVYSLNYIVTSGLDKLYTFAVTDEVLSELKIISSKLMAKYMNHTFSSLDILKTMEID